MNLTVYIKGMMRDIEPQVIKAAMKELFGEDSTRKLTVQQKKRVKSILNVFPIVRTRKEAFEELKKYRKPEGGYL